MNQFEHITVLLDEAVNGLNIKTDGIYVDATFGAGGHSQKILEQLGPDGQLFAFDQDQSAIEYGHTLFSEQITKGQVKLIHSNFRELEKELAAHHISRVDGVLYDLGVSSPQLDQAERGFSYQQDANLDMRMDKRQSLTAADIVNQWSFNDLVRIFNRYGEEKYAKRIARVIERERKKQAIKTTFELVDCIKEGIPAASRRTGGHPAKRVFQALRIAVNDELGALESSLEQALDLLAEQGRISAISFHSLEDRMIKSIFKEYSQAPYLPADLPLLASQLPQADYQLINKKVIKPSDQELSENNRARSAKLRIIERIKD